MKGCSMWKAILATCVMAGTALGQATQPTTAPATMPTTQPDSDVRRINRQLAEQNAALRAENQRLAAELESLRGEVERLRLAAAPKGKAGAKGELRIGMTMDEAQAAMGRPGKLAQEDATEKTYEWDFYRPGPSRGGTQGTFNPRVAPQLSGGSPTSILDYTVWARFRNGKLVEHGRY